MSNLLWWWKQISILLNKADLLKINIPELFTAFTRLKVMCWWSHTFTIQEDSDWQEDLWARPGGRPWQLGWKERHHDEQHHHGNGALQQWTEGLRIERSFLLLFVSSNVRVALSIKKMWPTQSKTSRQISMEYCFTLTPLAKVFFWGLQLFVAWNGWFDSMHSSVHDEPHCALLRWLCDFGSAERNTFVTRSRRSSDAVWCVICFYLFLTDWSCCTPLYAQFCIVYLLDQ